MLLYRLQTLVDVFSNLQGHYCQNVHVLYYITFTEFFLTSI